MPARSSSARRKTARVVAIGGVALTVGIGATVAWAAIVTDNMFPTRYAQGICRDDPEGGDGRITCRTDNATLTYYMDSKNPGKLEADDKADVRKSMKYDFNPTDLKVKEHKSPVLKGSAETDIIYQESSSKLPRNADGVTWCNDAASSTKCDQQYVRIRPQYTRGMACHETGHAVGLLHGDQAYPKKSKKDKALGCMKTPVGSNQNLGSNNKGNINRTY